MDRESPRRLLDRLVSAYFRSAPASGLETIRPHLWRREAAEPPEPQDAAYWSLLLEQYKLYVEMADRVSARRGLANVFFLTLNTAVFTAIGVFWQHPPAASRGLLVVPWIVLVGQCLAWLWILRSYRQLNTAKYAVVGALEERLPASPYWRAEWAALGRDAIPPVTGRSATWSSGFPGSSR